MAEVADAAAVSRATAFRYFPRQDLLLAEAALDLAVPNIAEILADPLLADDPADRLDAVVGAVYAFVVAHDQPLRTLLRLSLDAGDPPAENQRRGGRRIGWVASALAPARAQLGDEQFRRLVLALALCTGIETQIVLRDVCGLDADEATEVTHWTAQALLRAALAT